MHRNMIEANKAIFQVLDEYCARAGEPIQNSGTARWITTTSATRQFLKNAALIKSLSFSPSLKLARFDYLEQSFFVTFGFVITEFLTDLDREELDGGKLTAFLSELRPAPSASPAQIRDVVEFADKDASPEYDGHDSDLLARLFPPVQLFSTKRLLLEESYRVFFLICLSFTNRPDHWIDNRLAEVLRLIAEMSPQTVPYGTLCRSILDKDPGALFLALYRCLESLYAYTQSLELMGKLGISRRWSEMAQTLEEVLGWYPREEASLEALLAHALEHDLRSIAIAVNEPIPTGTRVDAFVAKRIYQLRNALVHYRPFHQVRSLDRVDWNRLCEYMALLIFHIYTAIETPSGSPASPPAAASFPAVTPNAS